MADIRKYFRPRRLAFGGRRIPRACIFGASLMLLSALAPAHAEDAGLKNGAASLAAGKYDNAVRQLSATVNSETASPGDAAKAMYLRGIAYRKLGQPSRAIADLGAAIWLGLPDSDRVKALVNRGLAYQAAGLSKEGEAEIALARKAGGSREVDQLIAEGGGSPEGAAAIAAFATEVRPEESSAASRARDEPLPSFNTTVSGGEAPPPPSTRTADASAQWTTPANKPAQDAAPGSWSTSVDGGSPKSSGNRLTRWFGSGTDSSDTSPSQPSPTPAAAPSEPAARPAPPPAAANSSWSTKTETQEPASGGASGGESKGWGRLFNRTAEADPAPAPPASSSAGGGGYRLQLATSRSEEEAKALWKKVSQNQGLAGARPEIEKVDIGDFGTFYSLRVGPFPDKAESLKVCNALKRSGVDCSPATP